MAGGKNRDADGKLARKFVSCLAKELVTDSQSGYSLASNPLAINNALEKSVESLAPGKSRSALQDILKEETRREKFVAALQCEIRAISVKQELHGDVILSPTASDHLFATLCNFIKGKSSLYATGDPVLSQEEIHLVLSRDPAPHILWAMAAVSFVRVGGKSGITKPTEIPSADDVSNLEASESPLPTLSYSLFHCLKPWIAGRNASITTSTLAPLIPLIFNSIERTGKDVSNLKILRTLTKEILSFIAAAKYRDNFVKGMVQRSGRQSIAYSDLLDGFQLLFEAFEIQGNNMQIESLSTTDKLSHTFPFAPDIIGKILKPPEIYIDLLADIVKAEFLLIYMVLEVLCLRKKLKDAKKLDGDALCILSEQVVRIAVVSLPSSLMLDFLSSGIASLNKLLDAEEKSIVCAAIFRALLFDSSSFPEKNKSSNSKKNVDWFIKILAVARKVDDERRIKLKILDSLVHCLSIPAKVFDYVASGKVQKSPSHMGTMDARTLIGWLLQLDDKGFQALVEVMKISSSQDDERTGLEESDAGQAKECRRLEEPCSQARPDDDLFFMDTTGENYDSDTPTSGGQSKKSKKRKVREVLFHRQGRAFKFKEDQQLNGGKKTSGIAKGKSEQGGSPVSSHDTEDGNMSETSTASSDSR
ncbi:hypothetical protein KP509_21G043800 [Ceratopteris richardii]|uniref:Uncharacterized protein n=1 Tax=Ceratopteris richardii TaxID=49495 RepID=A0A8T2SBB8_CERRI|nr:hypothetical protein KP509_21G043800 [Ceratopteris richardii]